MSVGSTGGEVTAELTEVSEVPEFQSLWVVVAVVIAVVAIGFVVLAKKRNFPRSHY